MTKEKVESHRKKRSMNRKIKDQKCKLKELQRNMFCKKGKISHYQKMKPNHISFF